MVILDLGLPTLDSQWTLKERRSRKKEERRWKTENVERRDGAGIDGEIHEHQRERAGGGIEKRKSSD